MSQITKILDSIFQNNGGTTKQWREANEILLTKSDEAKKYVAYMKNKIRDLNKDIQLLALDFLDYSIDDGKMPLWTQVGSKDFLQSLINIYKTRNEEDVQMKILFLIKKWANKFQKYNTIIPNFTSTYENLKNNDVDFPHDMESTYEKYLQGSGIESGFKESKKIKDEKNASKNKTYVKDINVDLRTNSYEKKYRRLVNKLDDWTQQIQDANVYMDLAKDGKFDDELRGICEELETGKKQLVDTIESGKLKDEKLMEISLNVQEDIETTLKRWKDVKNGRMPENFQSSFFSQRENNIVNYNNSNDNNSNKQNKGGFDLLGFENEFGENNNNMNNNSNKGNDLLDVFSSPQNSNQSNNDFFNNMGSNNQNNNILGNMNSNNNNNFFQNNNVFGNNNQNNNSANNFFGNNSQNPQNQNNNFFGNNNQNSQNQNNNFFGNNSQNPQNQNNNFFGNNNQNNQNQNNNFFGNNSQNASNQNSNNDFFSQIFNNNSNNNSNLNNNNLNSNNLFSNNFNNSFNNNSFNNNNTFNNQFVNLSSQNSTNNQINLGNNNNFNNIGFNNNNFNNNFNLNDDKNKKNISNKDYVFNF